MPATTNDVTRYQCSGALNTLLALSGVAFAKTLMPVECKKKTKKEKKTTNKKKQ